MHIDRKTELAVFLTTVSLLALEVGLLAAFH